MTVLDVAGSKQRICAWLHARLHVLRVYAASCGMRHAGCMMQSVQLTQDHQHTINAEEGSPWATPSYMAMLPMRGARQPPPVYSCLPLCPCNNPAQAKWGPTAHIQPQALRVLHRAGRPSLCTCSTRQAAAPSTTATPSAAIAVMCTRWYIGVRTDTQAKHHMLYPCLHHASYFEKKMHIV